MSNNRFTLPAYAKINLGLRVLGRRADNFHEILTIFQTITLHDRLAFEALDDERFELSCSAPDIPGDERNLVYRAALALRKHYDVRKGARVSLHKLIPAEGGLGGGSADAAIALLGLTYLWGMKASKSELVEIGARLGADVPFFLTGGTALGTGLGTNIRALDDLPEKHLVVIKPCVKVSTAEAYKTLNAPVLTKANDVAMLPVSHADSQTSNALYDVMSNDFEAVIFRLYPPIEQARDALLAAGAQRALLAGSGASVFGIFDNEKAVARACYALRGEVDGQVFACATLSRREYIKSLGSCVEFL